jgi:hypothetical protein
MAALHKTEIQQEAALKAGGKTFLAAVVAAGLLAPASADAAISVTLTGDDGQPAPLAAGAPPTIRNMDAGVSVALAQGDATSWRYVVTDATGTPITYDICYSSVTPKNSSVPYRGNGTYTLSVQLFNQSGCASPKGAPAVFQWNVAAGVAVGQPAGPLLLRNPGTLSNNVHLLDFAANPGTSIYEIKYAKGGVIGPDGGISGATNSTYIDSASGKVRFSPNDGPGQYVIVARAQRGNYYTPWSAPVTVNMMGPFDLSNVSFPDSRGPSYQLRGVVREKALAGSRITVAIAKGKKGKKFKTLGKPKVTSQGVFKLRFRASRGTYRLRYSFKGNSVIVRGTAYEVIKIRRVLG